MVSAALCVGAIVAAVERSAVVRERPATTVFQPASPAARSRSPSCAAGDFSGIRAALQKWSADADYVIVRIPSVEQLGAELEALQRHAAGLPDDQEEMLEHLAKLRALAVYLNVHLIAPKIPEV